MKRHISLFVAVLMLITLLPVSSLSVAATGIAVSSVSPDGTATLPLDQSSITVTFVEDVSTADLSGIKFTGVKNGISVNVGKLLITAEGTTATIKFGKLVDGATYTLDLSDLTGTETKYTYTAARVYELNEDFEVEDDETFNVATDMPSKLTTSNVSASWEAPSSNGVEGGRLKVESATNWGALTWTLPTAIWFETGSNFNTALNGRAYVAEAVVRGERENASNDTHFAVLAGKTNSSGINYGTAGTFETKNTTPALVSSNWSGGSSNWSTDVRTYEESDETKTVSYYVPKLAFTCEPTTGYISSDAYDEANSSYVGYYVDKNNTIGTRGFGKINFVDVGTSKGVTCYVESVKAYWEPLLTTLEDITYDENEFKVTVVLSDDIDSNNTNLETVTVSTTVGEEATPATITNREYNAAERTLTLTLDNESLVYGNDYTVDMTALTTTDNFRNRHFTETISVIAPTKPYYSSVSFTNESDASIDGTAALLSQATEVKVSATVENLNRESIFAVLAVYDVDSSVTKLTKAVILTTVKDGTSFNISGTTGTIPAGADKAALFVWDSSETLIPLFAPQTISEIPAPLEITGGFYGDKGGINQEISYAENYTNISAKLNLSAGEPPEGLTATLKLMRAQQVKYESSKQISFTGETASIELAYVANEKYPLLPTIQERDKLVITVTDGTETLFEKSLLYNDQSMIVDILLVAGQSNALGQGGNAEGSIKPELSTVYYNTMGDTTLTTSGNQGWDSALGKQWHDLTGRTVLIVKAAWGGTGFPTQKDMDTGVASEWGSSYFGYWNPNNGASTSVRPIDCYTNAKTLYAKAIASIDTDKYTIGNRIYFWNQGENENASYTASEYETAFLELHNKFKTEFGTQDTRLQYGGILPVRSPYESGFPNLKLTGPRIAQYKIADENDDIIIAMNATEYWYSDASITDWFDDGSSKTWSDIMNSDKVHYTQKALNEFGIQAAEAMYAYLYGDGLTDGIDLITPTGIKHYKNGDDIFLETITADSYTHTTEGVIPVVPAMSGAKAQFTITGNAAQIDKNGVMTAKPTLQNDYSTLTVKIDGQEDMAFKVYSPLEDDTISIASVKNNLSAIYTLTADDGYKTSTALIDNMLEENGLVATMGLVPAWMEGKKGFLTFDEAKVYVDNGRWSVANHTLNHNQSKFASLTAEQLEEEIDSGRNKLIEKFSGQKVLGIYTPGGQTSDLILEKVKENHYGLRLATRGYNSLPMTDEEIFSINVQAVGGNEFTSATSDATTMNGWLDTAITNKQWLCEMWHGVAVPDSQGNLPDGSDWGAVSSVEAGNHLKYVASKRDENKLWIATLDEVIAYTTEKLKARISLTSSNANSMSFVINDELDDVLFDEELTINVLIPDGATGASVIQNGNSIESTVNNSILTFNVAPSDSAITITWSFN